jgi:hypothetical protein
MLATLELLNQSSVKLAKMFEGEEDPSKTPPRKKLKFKAKHKLLMAVQVTKLPL